MRRACSRRLSRSSAVFSSTIPDRVNGDEAVTHNHTHLLEPDQQLDQQSLQQLWALKLAGKLRKGIDHSVLVFMNEMCTVGIDPVSEHTSALTLLGKDYVSACTVRQAICTNVVVIGSKFESGACTARLASSPRIRPSRVDGGRINFFEKSATQQHVTHT